MADKDKDLKSSSAEIIADLLTDQRVRRPSTRATNPNPQASRWYVGS